MKNLPKIYVMDRGWVLVGVPRDSKDKILLALDNCHVVRRWGTTKGIGELAQKGPLKETILELEGDGIEINRLFVHHSIPCSEKGWAQWAR
jgi:hypothetical protein